MSTQPTATPTRLTPSEQQLVDLIYAVRKEREHQGLTRADLAAVSGLGVKTIRHFEHFKGRPRLETGIRIAQVLGMTLAFHPNRTPSAADPEHLEPDDTHR